jgi:hypothetical protein
MLSWLMNSLRLPEDGFKSDRFMFVLCILRVLLHCGVENRCQNDPTAPMVTMKNIWYVLSIMCSYQLTLE